MSKTEKKNSKGLVKCAIAGVSLMLCMSMFPVASIKALADEVSKAPVSASTVVSGQKAITVSAENKTVKKGDKYTIPTAMFGGSEVTDIKVSYKGRNENIEIEAGAFTAEEVGTYVISYIASEAGKTYTYDFEVKCEVSDVAFEFDTNSNNIIPSVYDLNLLAEKNMIKDEKGPDIVLPLPKVKLEDKEEFEDVTVSTVRDDDFTGVVVRLSNSTSNLQIKTREVGEEENKVKEFYIDGGELASKKDGKYANTGVYKIVYTYYENGVYVAQEIKQFEVKEEYYKNNKDEIGYTLGSTFASAQPTSAVTGVEKELPSVTGKTTDTKESYTIPVNYSIQITHKEDGKWVDRTKECLDSENQRLFTPFKDGDYKITYIVKDFYNNQVKVENTTFYINEVKDTKAPVAVAYDANPDINKNDTEKLIDAKSKIKSKTVDRNIIVYAIGIEDNVKNEKAVLTRAIKDAAGSPRVEIKEYNDKNLIVNISKDSSTSSVTAYQQLLHDNYVLRQEAKKANITTDSTDEQISAWLISKNYLVVTKDFNKNPVTGENFDLGDLETDSSKPNFDIAAIKAKLAEQGFAYIDYGSYTFSEQTYRVSYEVTDDAGNKTTTNYPMRVTTQSYVDEVAPTISFSTSLQSTYLPDDKFEFKAPVPSDSTDERLDMVFGYRYLNASKNAITSSEVGKETSTMAFTVNDHSIVKNKKTWYAETIGDKTSDGWYILEQTKEDETFKVDLKEKLAGAAYIEIFAYATDDYGNIGFFDKVITIAEQNDTDPLNLYKVDGYDKTAFEANTKITLPTLSYDDDYVEYINASVNVYYMGNGEADFVKKQLQASDMKTYFDTNRGIYIVEGGSFMASRAGNYQVSIVATDAGNNSIATFFDYTVSTNAVIEDPVIDNISSETIELKVGEDRYLPAPTVSITSDSNVGYYGVSEQDDQNTATYYTTKMVSAENSNYKLTQNNFVANASGVYTIQYEVYLIQYNKNAFSETKENNKLYINDKGQFRYADASGKEYVVYVDFDADKKPVVKVDDGKGGNAISAIPAELGLKAYTVVSDPQTFKVGAISAPVITVDEDTFISTNIKTDETTGTKKIAIPNISGTVEGDGYVDMASSKIEVSVSRGSGTTTLATIYGDKYATTDTDSIKYSEDDKTLYLELKYDGTYSFKYSAQAVSYTGEKIGDPATKSFSLEYGDTEAPTIKIEKLEYGFLNKKADEYQRNDLLRLNIDHLTLKDPNGGTTEEELRDSIKIKVVNSNTDKEIKNQSEGNYEYKLETAGEYKITITIKDNAGWTTTETVTITVGKTSNNNINVTQTVGIVFIVISVVVLAGVITYFVVSKVKLDKKSGKKKSKK